MIYWWFDTMNPLIAVLVLGPFIAILLGVFSYYWNGFKIVVTLGLSFMLPLLFIASDVSTLLGNMDSWFIYGIGYVIISWSVHRLLRIITGYKS